MVIGFFGFGVVSFAFDEGSVLNSVFITLAIASVILGYAVIIGKMESRF